MNTLQRLTKLNARIDKAVDFARGDYAVPFLARKGAFDVSRLSSGPIDQTSKAYKVSDAADWAREKIKAAMLPASTSDRTAARRKTLARQVRVYRAAK